MTTEQPVHLLDVGVLVALTNGDHVHHQRTRQWFAQITRWATTPITEAGFVRLMLNPVVTGVQRRTGEVLTVLRALQAKPGHVFITDDAQLSDACIDLSGLVGHRQVTDLHLVDLAARHGLVLATLDAKLARALISADQRHVTLV